MRTPQLPVIPSAIAAVCLMASACAPQSAQLIEGDYIAFFSATNSVTLRKELLDLEGAEEHWQVDCRVFTDMDRAVVTRLEDRLPICGWTDDEDEADPDCAKFDEYSSGDQEDRCIEDYIFNSDSDTRVGNYPTADDKKPVTDKDYFGDDVFNIADFDDDNDGYDDYVDCDDDNADIGPGMFLQLGGGSGHGTEVTPAQVAAIVEAEEGSYWKRGELLAYDPSTLVDVDDFAFFMPLGPEYCENEADGFWPPRQEAWLGQDGYEVITEALDPWRGEGLVTHEGDLLVGFHHHMPGKADLRFQFAIDRFFQPTECVVGEDGKVVGAALDGNWVEEWSKDALGQMAALEGDDEAFAPYAHFAPYLPNDNGEGGGRLFFLNSGSNQFDPNEGSDFWYLPEQWEAGAAQGFLGEDRLVHRSSLFVEPELFNLFTSEGLSDGGVATINDLFTYLYLYCDEAPGSVYESVELEDGTVVDPSLCQRYFDERMDFIADQAQAETAMAMRSDIDDDPGEAFAYRPMTHRNKWRAIDDAAAGFDSWSEIHYSYVVFSADSDLRVGGRAEGAFTLVLDGSDTNSRVIVRGQFEIPKIKRDTWAPRDLRDDKREESGVEFCAY